MLYGVVRIRRLCLFYGTMSSAINLLINSVEYWANPSKVLQKSHIQGRLCYSQMNPHSRSSEQITSGLQRVGQEQLAINPCQRGRGKEGEREAERQRGREKEVGVGGVLATLMIQAEEFQN